MKSTLSHKDLVVRAERWLLKTYKCGFAFSELTACTNSGEIPDAIGFKYGNSVLVECKATRSDFLGDRKKQFRKMPEYGMGSLRYFMTPPGLVTEEEVKERYPHWGLLIAHPKVVKNVLKAKHQEHSIVDERLLLCSALRRVHLRGDLSKIYDRSTIER